MRRRPLLVLLALAALATVALLPAAAGGRTSRAVPRFALLDLRFDGGEPSVAYDAKHDATLYAADLGVKRIRYDVRGRVTEVSDAGPALKATTLDTILAVDKHTSRLFLSYLLTACSHLQTSDDAGATWSPSTGCGAGALLDHQSVGAGPLHAPVPATAYPGAVYYCAQDSFNGQCSVSLDGGTTFLPAVPAVNTPANLPGDPFGGACSALHGHLQVGPDGTAYLPLKGCGGTPTYNNLTNNEFAGGRPSLSVTEDNGLHWTVRLGPDGHNQDESDPSLGIGPQGTLYFGWQDGTNPSDTRGGDTSSARIAISTDHGRTWTRPVDLSTPLGLHNVQFPQVVVGDEDRAAMSFIGTPGYGDDQDNSFRGAWHLYTAFTYDRGRTWTTVDLTPTKPIARGCIHMTGLAPGTQRTDVCDETPQRNMLDFNDITMDGYGRVQVAYTDACLGACASGRSPFQSGREAMLAHQTSGRTLLRRYDPVFAPTAGRPPAQRRAPAAHRRLPRTG